MRSLNIVYDKAVRHVNTYVMEPDLFGFRFDQYSQQAYPVNGPHPHTAFDYHLPLRHLLQKYFPDHAIRELAVEELQENEAFIYPLTFVYLCDFLASHRIIDLLAQLPAKISAGLRKGKGILLLNDSHEFASYIHFKGMHFSNVLNSFKGLDDELLSHILIASSNPENAGYRGTDFSGTPASPALRAGNYLLNRFYASQKDPRVRVFGFRFFEEVVAAQVQTFYPHYDFNDKMRSLGQASVKTFICLNNINKDFRSVLCYRLDREGLREQGLLSHRKIRPEEYDTRFFGKWNTIVEQRSWADFTQRLPFYADAGVPVSNPWNLLPWELLQQTFCWLVTETLFEGDLFSRGFFTEKIYKPISSFMPFILVAQAYALHNLRQEGFRTFGQWWDESYDTETDPQRRMQKIVELVQYLCRKDQEELRRMYREMEPVLRHNRQRLLQTRAAEPYIRHLLNTWESL